MAIALPTRSSTATPWRLALPALLALLCVLLVVYRDTYAGMVAIWSRSGTFAHAFLVPPIVLWLVWRQRAALAVLQPRLCPWMLAPMAVAAGAWLLGDLGLSNAVTQLAATAMLVLAVPLVLGTQVARVILFPLLFSFFAVPLGEFLMPRLIDWTADFTVGALRASTIPVYREGTRFVIPSGSWSVVEACSGVRYLISSLMVGTLFAYLNYRSMWRRWVFVGFALAVPIVANWIRAYLIVLLGHLSNNRLAVGVDHLIYGWLFFGLVVGVMYAVGMRWSEPPAPLQETVAPAPARVGQATGRPQAFWSAAAAAMVLALLPQTALVAMNDAAPGALPAISAVGDPASGWRSTPVDPAAWKPAFRGPSTQAAWHAVAPDGRAVDVYLGYYRQQGPERKLIGSDNQLVRSEDPVWSVVGAEHGEQVGLARGPVAFRSAELHAAATETAPERQIVAWRSYWAGDGLTDSDTAAQVRMVEDKLLGRGDDAAVIFLSAAQDQPGGARAALEAYARANLEAIVAQLQRARTAAAYRQRHS